jgi:DNA polymerase-1
MLSGINLLEIAGQACESARLNLEIADHYMKTMDKDQKFLLEEMDLPLSVVLAKMQQYGVSLDLPFLKQLGNDLDIELKKLEQKIYGFASYPFNINSTQQLQKVLFEELKLSTKSKTKTGYSTDASVLESLKTEHDIIPLLLDYRQFTKLKSTYVDALPKMISPIDERLHGEFNQTVTSTGRLSSSNPNLQNIPIRTELGRSIRKAFIPGDKKWFLLSADYSQIELRLLAHMSGDDRLIDAFNKDQDIHARTAGEIFDEPIEKVSSDMRRIGKTLNFALIYQQGPYATAKDLGVSTKEASAFIDKYFRRYAKVKTFMEATIENARQTGYVETLWKRRRYFKFLHDRNEALKRADERAACNAPLQGSAADLMKLAMIRLDRELTKRNLQAKLILQVHDELVLEVPENELVQVKEVIINAMLMDQPFKVPLKVDVGTGYNNRHLTPIKKCFNKESYYSMIKSFHSMIIRFSLCIARGARFYWCRRLIIMKNIFHPPKEDISLFTILYALSEPLRFNIIEQLANGQELTCGAFRLNLNRGKSTMTHHFKVLRDAGLIQTRVDGREHYTSLRRDDIEKRFPGLLDTMMTAFKSASKDTEVEAVSKLPHQH